MLAPKMPSGSRRRTYGHVGRGLEVREQNASRAGSVSVLRSTAYASLRQRRPIPASCASLLSGSRHRAGGGIIFTTNGISRTHGGHRGLDAHRVSEKPSARKVMRCEESEQVGGHGVVGV
jgi:hypothetical protein